MRYVLIAFVGIILASCATRVPYTNEVRDEFGLDTEQAIRKVQFITSATIIFEKNKVFQIYPIKINHFKQQTS